MTKIKVAEPPKSVDEETIDRMMIKESIKILKKLADDIVQVTTNINQIKELLDFSHEANPMDYFHEAQDEVTDTDDMSQITEEDLYADWDE